MYIVRIRHIDMTISSKYGVDLSVSTLHNIMLPQARMLVGPSL